ncbi:MAG: GTP-binding protein [Candidatus Woesearchaeota archaeon]
MGLDDLRAQIQEIEKELATTKYNKRTQHHIGLVKAKLARLKQQLEQRSSHKGQVGKAYAIKKSGDATVALLGFPSVGKSTLLNALTNAQSAVAEYAFTTVDVIPGLLEYKHAKIQILDLPGIIKGAASGRGRGKEVLSVLRSADLVLMVIDVFHPEHYQVLLKEITDAHLRLNVQKPDVKIVKTEKDGIQLLSTVPLPADKKTFVDILKEFKITNASVIIRSPITLDDFIDCIEANKHYTKGVVVLNKIDLATPQQLQKAKEMITPDILISAKNHENIEMLKEVLYQKLEFIAIYLKEPGKKADLEVPLVIKKGSTLYDLCGRLHRDFIQKFRYARIWGSSAKFDGQIIQKLDHQVQDNDIVEIHLA